MCTADSASWSILLSWEVRDERQPKPQLRNCTLDTESCNFGYRYLRDSGKIPESITVPSLRIYNNWDPGQSSSTFSALEFPKLQAFGPT